MMSIASNFENREFCGNCCSSLSENIRKVTAVRLQEDLIDEILVCDALAYIYGVQVEEVQEISQKYSKTFLDCARKDTQVPFCDPCASLLTENYKIHKLFESRIDPSSFVGQVKKLRVKEWASEEPRTQSGNIVSPSSNSNQGLADTLSHEDEAEGRKNGEDDDSIFEDFIFEDERDAGMTNSEDEIDEKYEEAHESGQEPQDESNLLRRSPRMKNVVVKLEKLSAEDLQAKFGIKMENYRISRKGSRKNNRVRAGGEKRATRNPSDLKNEKPMNETVEIVKNTKKSSKYKCKVCGKVFRDRYHCLRVHLPRHSNTLKFTCDICGKGLATRHGLFSHKKLVHVDETEKEKRKSACEFCGKLISNLAMKHHIERQHSTPREMYKCEPCDKTFICKISYDEHMLTHSKDFEPIICAICGKSFKFKSSFQYHEKTHTSEKKYSCDVCQLKFFLKSQMLRHKESVHTTEKKFVCETCGKNFKFQKYFKKHLKIHEEVSTNGEYSVKCEECDKFFIHSLSLYKHRVRFHRPDLKKKVHKCAYCEKILCSGTVLRIHEKIHQNDPGNLPRETQTGKDITHGKLKNAGTSEPT